MTTTTMPQANGHRRPTLAEQINRLDKTLDGLADGLNEAVADAVRSAVGEAVRTAVQEVLTEVFTNPDVLGQLQELLKPLVGKARVTPPKPSAWQRVSRVCQYARTCLVGLLVAGGMQMWRMQTATTNVWQRAVQSMMKLAAPVRLLHRFQNEILVAVGIGVTLGLGAWFAGPWFGALTSGIGGFTTTLSLQAGWFLRKMFTGAGNQPA